MNNELREFLKLSGSAFLTLAGFYIIGCILCLFVSASHVKNGEVFTGLLFFGFAGINAFNMRDAWRLRKFAKRAQEESK